MTRTQDWLEDFFTQIYVDHFIDVQGGRLIKVIWGRKARTRLGSLSYDPKQDICIVRLTKLFQDTYVPEFVLKATLVHELTHYAHGFHSGLPQQHQQPHAGGVIRKEFAERGLESLYVKQKRWLRANWTTVVLKHYPDLQRRPRKIQQHKSGGRMRVWWG